MSRSEEVSDMTSPSPSHIFGDSSSPSLYGKRGRKSGDSSGSSAEEELVAEALSEASTAQRDYAIARQGLSESVDMAYINSLLSLYSFGLKGGDGCIGVEELQAHEIEERIKEWTKVQRAARSLQRAFRRNAKAARAARLIQQKFRLRKRREKLELHQSGQAFDKVGDLSTALLALHPNLSSGDGEAALPFLAASPHLPSSDKEMEVEVGGRKSKPRSRRASYSGRVRDAAMEEVERIETAARALQRYLRSKLKRAKAAVRIQRAYRERYTVASELRKVVDGRSLDRAASALQRAFRSHYDRKRQQAAMCIQQNFRRVRSQLRSRVEPVEIMELRHNAQQFRECGTIEQEAATIKSVMEDAINAMEKLEKSTHSASDVVGKRRAESPASGSASHSASGATELDSDGDMYHGSDSGVGSDMDGAALRIQTRFRTWTHRRRFIRMRGATIRMQTIFRGRSFWKAAQPLEDTLCWSKLEEEGGGQGQQFSVPSYEECACALGTFGDSEGHEQALLRMHQLSSLRLQAPLRNDWLSFFPEKGQSVDEYKQSLAQSATITSDSSRKKRGAASLMNTTLPVAFAEEDIAVEPTSTPRSAPYIYVAPVGLHERSQQAALKRACDYLERFMQTNVVLVASLPLRARVKARPSPDEGRPQLCAPDMIRGVARIVPKDARGVIIVTSHDLYPSEEWNYVFGAASGPARAAVVSCSRLGLDEGILVRRLARLMAHELLHVFGLRHCVYYRCLMNGSSGLQEADRRPTELCPVCLRKLSLGLRFDRAFHAQSVEADRVVVDGVGAGAGTLRHRFEQLKHFASTEGWGREAGMWASLEGMAENIHKGQL